MREEITAPRSERGLQQEAAVQLLRGAAADVHGVAGGKARAELSRL